MTTQIHAVRPIAESDIAELQQIDTTAHGHTWSHRTYLDEIEQQNRVHLVAEASDGIVGHAAAWINESSCHITNVAIAGEHVGQGHATTLLLALLDQVVGQPQVANLQLEVRPSNRRAQRLYGRFGFMPVGAERNFYERSDEQGSADAVLMAVPDICAEPWRERLAVLREKHEQVESDRDAGVVA